jgi:HD-GYP domain-containing protein (c-di-GMP phosphodiesterase class II)
VAAADSNVVGWRTGRSEGQRSDRELEEKIRELKQNLLETIETLNAAVEARDPYTAGHSQRVRRIAVAVGRQLQLPEERLAGFETDALFHDIGKIAPDSILTKRERLTREEQTVMQEHVTRGADIIARFPPFRPAVPAIRHHHERWDGLGYPDRLRGDEIPLEAAIVGFADAWETITSDRGYAPALSLGDALAEIRAGRGKQFSPVVVDALWEVAKERPADVLPSAEPAATGIIV